MRAAGHAVTGYFYNPNIHPYQEYARRLDAVKEMAEKEDLPMIIHDDYDLEGFLSNVASEPDKRCSWCYASRLSATARVAAAGGFEAFTASLLYSRYQRHEEIRELGDKLGSENNISFLYQDFRVGWQEGIRLSKELGLYRQQYCGCIYSEKERYFSKGSRSGAQGTKHI
jgi:predicted adenine nucleotide alpha hydrolase (AANH) superfamily ATPase